MYNEQNGMVFHPTYGSWIIPAMDIKWAKTVFGKQKKKKILTTSDRDSLECAELYADETA